jgi:hypothetical protein
MSMQKNESGKVDLERLELYPSPVVYLYRVLEPPQFLLQRGNRETC